MSADVLTLRIQAMTEGIDKAFGDIKMLEAELDKSQGSAGTAGASLKTLGGANESAGDAAEHHGNKQTTLHHILGTSRREAGLLAHEMAGMAGATGFASQAISAFESGIGPVGAIIVGISIAVAILKEKIDEHNKALDNEVEALSRATISETEYLNKSKELASQKFDLIGAYQRQIAVQSRLDELTLQGVEYNAALAQAQREAAEAVDKNSAAHFKLGQRASETAAAALESAKAHVLEKDGVESVAKAMLPFQTFAGEMKTWNELTDIQRESMYKLADATKQVATLAQGTATNTPVGREEETQAAYDRAQYDMRMRRSHELRLLIGTNSEQIAQLEIANARSISDAYASAAKDAGKSLDSLIDAALKPSAVTPEDVARSKAGTYEPKSDENRRRVEIFKTIDVDINKDPEAQRILGLMPKQFRDMLVDAFNKGGIDKVHLAAMNIIDTQGDALVDPEKVADSVVASLQKAAKNTKLQDAVKNILTKRGVDVHDPKTQKALGVETGAERSQSIEAQFKFDKAKLQKVGEDAAAELNKLIAETTQPGVSVQTAVDNNKDSLKAAGADSALSYMTGFEEGLNNEDKGIRNRIAKSIAPDVAAILGAKNFGGGGDNAPARAAGGPVAAGEQYLVGEKGPEMFVPGSQGSIVPNNQLSSSGQQTTVHVNFNSTVSTASAFEMRKAARVIKGLLR